MKYNPALYQLRAAISAMIVISDAEMTGLLDACIVRQYKRRELLSQAGRVCGEIFFIHRGITRNVITDSQGVEHTTHFALENQFIADYASFLQQAPATYSLQALENTEVVVMPRAVIEWGYTHLAQGDRLGRLIAEYYFIYLDDRIKGLYQKAPAERYNHITELFPDIHNRVPQHMIASYLGITSVHLSRLKKSVRRKT